MKLLIAILVAVMLAGCTMSQIVKPDGTKISSSSLFQNTKKVELQDGDMKVIIGEQVISIGELADAASIFVTP